MPEYQSYNICGVDTCEFYWDYGTSISKVTEATGVNRSMVTCFAIGTASKKSVQKIAPYMERQNDTVYKEKILECQKEVAEIRRTIREAWKEYRMREGILNEYYRRYKIPKKCMKIRRITEREMMRKIY